MFPGTLNSSTLQGSGPASGRGSVLLLWKILQSTGGTGAGLLGLRLALSPSDRSRELSCGPSSEASAGPSRAQARLRRSHIHIPALLAKSGGAGQRRGWGGQRSL